jgi:nitrite reductase/ring-hydroxylating ferredoxin subunit
VRAGNHDVALVRAGGKLVALANRCLHRGGPMGEGEVDSDANTIACPWHGWEYDLATGKATFNPAARLDTYPVEVVGADIQVTI